MVRQVMLGNGRQNLEEGLRKLRSGVKAFRRSGSMAINYRSLNTIYNSLARSIDIGLHGINF